MNAYFLIFSPKIKCSRLVTMCNPRLGKGEPEGSEPKMALGSVRLIESDSVLTGQGDKINTVIMASICKGVLMQSSNLE